MNETESPHPVGTIAWLGCREWWEIDIEKPNGSGEYTTFASIFETLADAEAAMNVYRAWSNRKMRLIHVTNVRQPNDQAHT